LPVLGSMFSIVGIQRLGRISMKIFKFVSC
jgi:hypothetical protein